MYERGCSLGVHERGYSLGVYERGCSLGVVVLWVCTRGVVV